MVAIFTVSLVRVKKVQCTASFSLAMHTCMTKSTQYTHIRLTRQVRGREARDWGQEGEDRMMDDDLGVNSSSSNNLFEDVVGFRAVLWGPHCDPDLKSLQDDSKSEF